MFVSVFVVVILKALFTWAFDYIITFGTNTILLLFKSFSIIVESIAYNPRKDTVYENIEQWWINWKNLVFNVGYLTVFILFQLIFILLKDSAIQFLFRQNFASSINNLFVFVIGIVFFGISIEVYNKWGNDLAARWDVEFYAELPQPFEKIKEAIGGAVKLAAKVGGVGAFLGKNAKGKFLGTGVGQKYLEKKANVVSKYSEKIRDSAFGQSKIGKKLLSNKKLTNWETAIKDKKVRQGKGQYVTSENYSSDRKGITKQIFKDTKKQLSSDNIKAKVREKYNDFQNTNKGIYDRFKEQFDKGIVTKNTDEKLLTNNQLQLNNLKPDNKPLIDKLNALPAKFTETTKEGNNTIQPNTIQKETIIKETKSDIKEIKSDVKEVKVEKINTTEKIETITNNKESIKETVNKEHINIQKENIIDKDTQKDNNINTINTNNTNDINKLQADNSTSNNNVSDTNKGEKNTDDNINKTESNEVEEKPQDVVKGTKQEDKVESKDNNKIKPELKIEDNNKIKPELKIEDNNKTNEINESKIKIRDNSDKTNDDKIGRLIINFENIPKTKQDKEIVENKKPDWIIDLDNTINNVEKINDSEVVENKDVQDKLNNSDNINIENDKIDKPENKIENIVENKPIEKIDKTTKTKKQVKKSNTIKNKVVKKPSVKDTKITTKNIKETNDNNKTKQNKNDKIDKNSKVEVKKPNYDLGINYLNNSLSKEKTKQSLEINKTNKNNYDFKQWVRDNFKDKNKK
ncbi:hypothetical protein [Mycoplasma sp. 1012]